jgi:hypothetical protein
MARKAATKKTTAPKTTTKKEAPATGNGDSGQSWFLKGRAGMDKKHQLDKVAELRREKGFPRFYLKATPGASGKDNKARIVFLDSEGFFLYEHNLKLDGRWGNYFTCTKEIAPCPICTGTGDKPIYTCYYTVVDTRSFTRKDGTVSERRRVMFPAKGVAQDIIDKIRTKNKGSLTGLVVDVERLGEKDPNCGRDFEVVTMKSGAAARINPLKKFGAEQGVKVDYLKICQPPTESELIAAGVQGTVDSVGSEEDTGIGDDTAGSEEDMDSLLGD